MAGQTNEHEMAKVVDSTAQVSGKSTDATSALHQDAYHLDQTSAVVKALNSEASKATEATNKDLPGMYIFENHTNYSGGQGSNRVEPPTDAERKDAQSKLDGCDSELIPAEQKPLVDRMHKELTTGDANGLAKDLADFKKTYPADFEKCVHQLDKDLKANKAGVSIDLSADGKVSLYADGGNTALQIDSATGKMNETPITRLPDGRVVFQPGTIAKPDTAGLMNQISDTAVINMERHGKPNEIGNHLPIGWERPWNSPDDGVTIGRPAIVDGPWNGPYDGVTFGPDGPGDRKPFPSKYPNDGVTISPNHPNQVTFPAIFPDYEYGRLRSHNSQTTGSGLLKN